MSETPTPRTDAVEYYFSNHDSCAGESIYRVSDDSEVTHNKEFDGFSAPSNFARQLERELAEAREIVEMQKETMRQMREKYGLGERNVMRELKQQRDTLADALRDVKQTSSSSRLRRVASEALAAVKGGQHE
jgi:uncharacterized membrane protein YccC